MCTQATLEDLYLKLGKCKLRENILQRTFKQFRVFVFDPMLKNKNAEFAESFIKLSLLFQ